MEKSGLFFVIYAIYTVWLVVDLIKSKGQSMTKIVRRATIFFTIVGWLVYLVLYGNLVSSIPNYEVFQYIIGIAFMVMMWSFVAPHVHVEKGTPTYEMIKGGIIFILIAVVAITILVVTRP
nr:hypothetical protein [uncultured Acetobacterium sp.]